MYDVSNMRNKVLRKFPCATYDEYHSALLLYFFLTHERNKTLGRV